MAFLSSATPSMVIEVIPTPNHGPDEAALGLLATRAGQYCGKPGGIRLQIDDVAPVAPVTTGTRSWTFDQLVTLEQQYCRNHPGGGVAVLCILYVDGTFAQRPNAIAVSFTSHSIAFFKDMITAGGPEGQALVHELGHELGLVNGTTRQLVPHEDPTSVLHDVSQKCVMYYAMDPTGASVVPDDYCDKCKADLKAALTQN